MSRRIVFLIVCGIWIVAATGMILLSPGKGRQLASLTYLGTKTNLMGRIGQFTISNTCDHPIDFITILVESHSNGVPTFAGSNGQSRIGLPAHQTDVLEFRLPAYAKRWRGWVNVGEEKKGLASIVPRVKWFWGQMRIRFRNGVHLPTGRIDDGPVIKTQEIEQ
jgi:hypothetical protein